MKNCLNVQSYIILTTVLREGISTWELNRICELKRTCSLLVRYKISNYIHDIVCIINNSIKRWFYIYIYDNNLYIYIDTYKYRIRFWLGYLIGLFKSSSALFFWLRDLSISERPCQHLPLMVDLFTSPCSLSVFNLFIPQPRLPGAQRFTTIRVSLLWVSNGLELFSPQSFHF